MRRLLEAAMVTLIVALSILIYSLKYMSTPLLLGIDGPYYYVQVDTLLKEGGLKYPDPPLAFYILAVFAIMLGGDVTLGIKFGSVVVTMVAVYALYYLMRDVAGPEAGMVTAVLYAFSPYLARLCFDLIKNAMGLTFLSLTLLLSYMAISRRKAKYSILASISLLAVGITHVLDFAVSYSAVLLFFLLHFRERKLYRYTIPPVAAGSLLLLLGFISYSVMGGDPYKGIAFISSLAREDVEAEELSLRAAKVIYPLITGLAGLLLSLKLRGEARNLMLTLSLLIIILNLPVYPQQYIWRFNLMTAVLAPPIIGVALGLVRESELKVLLALIIVGLVAPQFISQLQRSGPSIPLEEYYELKGLISHIPHESVLVVPDVRLRYWVETLYPKVVKSPWDVEGEGNQVILLVENTRTTPKLKLPRAARLIWKGRFLSAYSIPPPPPR